MDPVVEREIESFIQDAQGNHQFTEHALKELEKKIRVKLNVSQGMKRSESMKKSGLAIVGGG